MDQLTRRLVAPTPPSSLQPRPLPAAADGSSLRGRLVGGAVVAVLFMGSTLLTPLYDLYRQTYGFSAVTLVLLYAVYVIGNLTALLLLGRLSDQLGRKPIALAGVGLAAVSALFFLLAQAPAWLFAARILSGCAVGLGAGAATAWITEFTPPARRPQAASVMTSFNFLGLALGPLAAGVLAQYAPLPLRLAFVAYLALLAVVAALVWGTPETLRERRPGRLSLKPRLGVPPDIRLPFLAPAATLFSGMALVGFFAALGPTTIRVDLHLTNRALASAAVAELFVVAALAILATRRLSPRAGMLAGLVLTPPGLALLVAAQALGSMAVFLAGTTVCGIAAAFGYRGGLQVTNQLAPADRRAEVVSAYFICGFVGNALPIIGVGVLSQTLGARTADMVFAGVVSVVAVAALAAGLAFRGGDPDSRRLR